MLVHCVLQICKGAVVQPTLSSPRLSHKTPLQTSVHIQKLVRPSLWGFLIIWGQSLSTPPCLYQISSLIVWFHKSLNVWILSMIIEGLCFKFTPVRIWTNILSLQNEYLMTCSVMIDIIRTKTYDVWQSSLSSTVISLTFRLIVKFKVFLTCL